MTNLLKVFSLLLFTVLFISSCSDDNDPGSDPDPNLPGEFMNCRITLIERDGFSGHAYTYDENGKLATHSNGSATYEYTYDGNVTTIKYYHNGDLQRTETVTNNDAGFAISIKAIYTNDFTPTRLTSFEYDNKNQLVKKTVKDEGDTDEDHTVYQWHEGNMVSETELDDDDMTTYTYTGDATQPAEWFNVINLERGYITIRNKNRVQKITNPDGITYTHSYGDDDDGRIESITISPSNNDPYTRFYSYLCD